MRRVGDVVAGRYPLAASLGGGGLGEVFRAFDLHGRGEVAIKVFAPERCAPEAWQRYAALVAAAARARPTALVLPRLHAAADGEPPHAIAELRTGEDLAALRARGPVPGERAVEIAVACARALAPVVAATGVAHRALKPGNLWLDPNGELRVLDYGVAELGTQPARPRDDQTHVEYRAPEQLEGAPGDARSDVFSLGVLLFELLTGVHPYAAPSAFKVAHKVLLQAAPRATAAAPGVPLVPEVEEVLARALARAPAERFADVVELARRLAQAQRSSVALLPFEDEAPPTPAPADDRSELVAAPTTKPSDDLTTMLILKQAAERAAESGLAMAAARDAGAATPPATLPTTTAPAMSAAPGLPPASAPGGAPPAISRALAQPLAQPTAQPIVQPPVQPTAQPLVQPTAQPAAPAGGAGRSAAGGRTSGPLVAATRTAARERDQDGRHKVFAVGARVEDEKIEATEVGPMPQRPRPTEDDGPTALLPATPEPEDPSQTIVATNPRMQISGEVGSPTLELPGQRPRERSSATLELPGPGEAPSATLELPGSGEAPSATLELPGSGEAPSATLQLEPTVVGPKPPGQRLAAGATTEGPRPSQPPAVGSRGAEPSSARLLIAVNVVAGLLTLAGLAWLLLRG